MTRKDISEAVGNINDTYVSEAGEDVKLQMKGTNRAKCKGRGAAKWITMAACACIVLLGVGAFSSFRAAHPWNVEIINMSEHFATAEMQSSIAVVERWEGLPIYEQYSSIEWNGNYFDSRSGEIPADRIGALLSETIAKGWDFYAEHRGENGEKTIGVKVYEVTGMSSECVVAVQYEGTDTWYAFINHRYKPETLGQFIKDMNLYEEIEFGTIYYSYTTDLGNYANVEFVGVEKDVVISLLLSNIDAENVYDEARLYEMPERILGISVDIPILGVENISLSVLEDGYIKTNILATGKMFYIGEENTKRFVDYVMTECEGYETIYVNEWDEIWDGIVDNLQGGEEPDQGMTTPAYNPSEGVSPSVGPQSTQVP